MAALNTTIDYSARKLFKKTETLIVFSKAIQLLENHNLFCVTKNKWLIFLTILFFSLTGCFIKEKPTFITLKKYFLQKHVKPSSDMPSRAHTYVWSTEYSWSGIYENRDSFYHHASYTEYESSGYYMIKSQ